MSTDFQNPRASARGAVNTPHPQADLLRAIADGKQMHELDFPGINHPGNWCDCDADRAAETEWG